MTTAELKGRLVEKHAEFVALFEEQQALCAERREYPSRYTLANQGQIDQLRATVEPKWSPLSVEFAFTDIADEASKAAEPVPDVHVSFNPDQPHSQQDLVDHYNLVQKARNLGVTTQQLPKEIPGNPPSPQFAHAGMAPVHPSIEFDGEDEQ